MKTWDQFQTHYLFDVHGCTYALAERAVRDAAREFCERTGVHRASLDAIVTNAAIGVYPFDAESRYEVAKVLKATIDGQPLAVLLPDAGENERGLIVLDSTEFLLQPQPATGSSVVVTAELMPASTATGIDDQIYASHGRMIAQGAKAILYAMGEQPFSNMEQAGVCRSIFESEIARVRAKVAAGYSRAPLRVVPSFV